MGRLALIHSHVRHTVVTVIALFLCLTVQAQDHFVLNLLVENSRTISGRLKERVAVDGAVMGSTTLVENKTEEFEEVLNDLDKRFDNIASNVNLATDLALLTKKTINTADLMLDAFDIGLDCAGKYPELLQMLIETEKETEGVIGDLYKIIAKTLSTGLKTSLATPEQRKMFLFMLDERVTYLSDLMKQLIRTCHFRQMMGQTDTNDQRLKDLLEGKGEEAIFERSRQRIQNMKF